MSSTTGPSVGRLEVFSMGFNIDDSSNIEDYSVRTDLVDLKKGVRIFFVGEEQFFELYNSKIAESLYNDLPNQQNPKLLGMYRRRAKKLRENSISEHVSKLSRKGAKKLSENSISEHVSKISGKRVEKPRENSISKHVSKLSGKRDKSAYPQMLALVEEEFHRLKFLESCLPNEDEYSLDLPLTGPVDGMIVDDFFSIVIHEDTGVPSEDNDYEKHASAFYINSEEGVGWGDKATDWIATTPDSYDEVSNFYYTNYEYGTLRLEYMMEYIVYRDSKAVDVYVEWCMPDSHICGEITVSNDKFADKKSVLIQTPRNKAIHAKNGELLKLSRFVVALPYNSGFTVNARLHDSESRLLVDDSVYFPFKPFYKPVNSEGYGYEDKKIIEDIIEVSVIVYV